VAERHKACRSNVDSLGGCEMPLGKITIVTPWLLEKVGPPRLSWRIFGNGENGEPYDVDDPLKCRIIIGRPRGLRLQAIRQFVPNARTMRVFLPTSALGPPIIVYRITSFFSDGDKLSTHEKVAQSIAIPWATEGMPNLGDEYEDITLHW